MRPTKPNCIYDAQEFAAEPTPRLATLECVPAREERRFHSFLFFGTHDLTQCSRDAEQIGGSAPLVGHG
jgi:hypothetical protein